MPSRSDDLIGSSITPKGLINYSGITSYTSLGTAADAHSGYPIHPADPTNMIGNVEEKNATFRSFIMRPLLWATLVNRRADAVSAGDRQGPFMFNILRDPGMDLGVDRLKVGVLNGYPVYKSTQLSTTRTRGNGTTNNTYVLGGDFSDFLIAMGGALEFQVSTQGDTPFVADQTWFKGVMYYDGAPRHEASFCLMDNVLTNT
jgi:HK97 family phage major capsid protein